MSLNTRNIRITRGLGIAVVLAILPALGGFGGGISQPQAPARQTATCGQRAVADRLPQVRLRKLHLVRPDLILYPISFEVDC